MTPKPSRTLGPRALKEASRFLDWLVVETGIDRAKAARAVKQFAEAIAGKLPPKSGQALISLEPCLQQYLSLYRQRHGEDPNVTGQDYALLSRLIRDHGPEAVTRRLNALFLTKDTYLRQCGFTIGMLFKWWNKLAAVSAIERRQMAQDAPGDCRHLPRCEKAVECNLKTLRDAQS